MYKLIPWVIVFGIIPEFRILRLTFCGKSASKCWIRQIKQASLIYFQYDWRQFTILTWNCYYFKGLLDMIKFEFRKFRILEILNFHPCNTYLCQFQMRLYGVPPWHIPGSSTHAISVRDRSTRFQTWSSMFYCIRERNRSRANNVARNSEESIIWINTSFYTRERNRIGASFAGRPLEGCII